jgi:predicted AlkP superfamily phosphohydrolase/phosphomutase
MSGAAKRKINRRTFLKRTAIAATAGAATIGAGSYWLGSKRRVSSSIGKKVIVIGVDGMDPGLTETMIHQGQLPNLAKLRDAGGFSRLGTSIPPQSPVAWANFINGAGPGSHGIFDFIHRHPHEQVAPFYSAAETIPGQGGWDVQDYKIPLDFWPFNHQPPKTELRRQGVPFWDFLDEAGISSTFYDLPSNYPPSPSHYGHHRCISGMGTPDMLGTYGTYQYFAENGPTHPLDEGGGRRTKLSFESETARARLLGPPNDFLKEPRPSTIEFHVYRDKKANAAAIDIQGHKVLLKPRQWSPWTDLDFSLSTPSFLPNKEVRGICRFYLQEVQPNFRLYVTPINMDPRAAAVKISEPDSFIHDVSDQLGPFYTTGFQEDHKARSNGIFADDEYLEQANIVLEERLALFDYALDQFEDGLLFFYFSSSDLQSHIFWWNSDDKHPVRSAGEAKKYFGHVQRLYQKLDEVIGEVWERYGSQAAIIVMSDHGFANFARQFNLNSWLRHNGYLSPPECQSILHDIDWSQTAAYGLGINGLYLNLKGRERHGIIDPSDRDSLLTELATKLEAVRDTNGRQVIRRAYRADQVYCGNATELAPDLIIGYSRGYRASWATSLGDLTDQVLLDNNSAWSADHCADALEVPGVLVANRPIGGKSPMLVDMAPSILAEFGLPTPATMEGRNVFA